MRWREVRRQASPFESLARTFKVSHVVSARRALDLYLVYRSSTSWIRMSSSAARWGMAENEGDELDIEWIVHWRWRLTLTKDG